MKYFRLAIALLLAAAVCGCATRNATSPISSDVSLTSGGVRTSARDVHGVLAFKGIPYAAPPVGDLRWRSPLPAMAWQGVLDATAFRSRCWFPPPPRGTVLPGGQGSEDCLTANVWTAARSTNEKRPVMVWIHGGGFQSGFPPPGAPATDGARFAAKGVVLVSFNYRLGVFGFLSLPALDREGTPSGNFGLQDQIAALKWVRANIAQFGGDPGNVTIFGESAGSVSVAMLMTSPLAKGLFTRAIGESGAFCESEFGSISTRAEAQARGQALTDRLAHGNLAELRAIPADTLGSATAWGLAFDPVTAAFSPSVDGFVLPDSPANAFAQGRQIDVPLLAGWNGAEEFIFPVRVPQSSAVEFRMGAAARFGEARIGEFLKHYPADTDATAKLAAKMLTGDLVIIEQTWEWLQLHRRTGQSPVYGYYFSYRSPYAPIPAHAVEIDFVFGTLTPQRLAPGTPPPGPRDRELSDEMMSYWVNFARAGDPNGPGVPIWPRYETDNSQVMVLDTTTAAGPESGTARFRFLQSFRKDGRLPESWRPAR